MSEPADRSARQLRHARTVSALAIAELAGKAASFVMFAAAARYLGPAGFGQFSWSFSLALLVSSCVVWGFDTTLIQLATQNRPRLDELLSNVLGLRLAGSAIALGVVLVVPGGPSDGRCVTVLVSLAVLADTANHSIRSGAAVLEQQRAVAINLVIQRLATAAIAIAIMAAGGGVMGMSVGYLAGTMVGVGLMFWAAHRLGLAPRPRLIHFRTLSELWRASAALGISNILNMLVFRMDAILLGWMASATAVGAYSAAYRLFETALFAVWSLDRVAMPAMMAGKGHAAIQRGVNRTVAAILAVYVPYVLVLGVRSDEVLDLLFGSPYGLDSGTSLQLLMLSLVPYSVQYMLAAGLLARCHNALVTWSGFTALMVNLMANLILIPRWGPAGAAGATLVAVTVQAAMLGVLLRRREGSARLLRAALLPVLAGAAMVPFLMSPLGLISAVVAASCAYCAVWFVAAGRLDPAGRRALLGLVGVRR